MAERDQKVKFKGKNLVIATMHNKEQVIAPIFTKSLGVTCFIPKNFDTDMFGTFTGEKVRIGNALETARAKAHRAMDLTHCDLAIASEGSFGQHPTLGFLNCDEEIMLFIDRTNKLEIWVREISLITNFNGSEIQNMEQLNEFAKKAGFPQHALIIKKSKDDLEELSKGIRNWDSLKKSFLHFQYKYGTAYAETDMRAMYNPTRMNVIADTAKKLLKRVKSNCPICAAPGYGIVDAKPGLPCELCGFPTRSTLSVDYKCQSCQFTELKLFPHGKELEEPIFCDMCNP